ncbi:MAG TPA: LysM domain-containing protein [Bacteroidota bacterium]|nr:LysM domain-containing protein [Bacteroidota bacterium]HUL14059.1 LysM domain-containing protein [Methylococcaceae bacterium]
MIDPNQALQALLQRDGLKVNHFPPTSRYYGLDTATLETPDGASIIYVRRRFLPQPDRFALLQEHVVAQGDRLDNITARYLGDPEQFWRICDANAAMRPDELTETIGRRLRITLPEGIPGTPNA